VLLRRQSVAHDAGPGAKTSPSANASQDDVFLALRDASRVDDSATALKLAARLPDYASLPMSTIIG
jgi:hypothetical protein